MVGKLSLSLRGPESQEDRFCFLFFYIPGPWSTVTGKYHGESPSYTQVTIETNGARFCALWGLGGYM